MPNKLTISTSYMFKYLIIHLSLLFPGHINGQALVPGCQPVIDALSESTYREPQTPEASSLAKYGDCPVSYFTGRPNISIPLYSLKSGNVSMPITLDYDATGVMVNSLPGWTGQNWTLNIGGVITREKHGFYDEWKYPSNIINGSGYFDQHQSYFECQNKLRLLYEKGKNNDFQELKDSLVFGKYDFAPDIFTFNFMGRSGKFFLGNDGTWKVMSNDNLQVIFDYKDSNNFTSPLFAKYPLYSDYQPKTIYGFLIKDDEGNTYHFGYNKDAIEYTVNFWDMSLITKKDGWHATSWYLTKVTDRFGNNLFNLDYERGAYLLQIFFSYYKQTDGQDIPKANLSMNTVENSSFPYTMNINSPVYLSKVCSEGTTIELKSSYVPEQMATENIYSEFITNIGNNQPYNLFQQLKMRTSLNEFYKGQSIHLNEMSHFYYLLADGEELEKYRYTPTRSYSTDYDRKYDLLGRTRMKRLESVVISAEKTMSYQFHHKYYNKRMCLEKLEVNSVGNDDEKTPRGNYIFTYNDFDRLPSDYLTVAVDHWGYYNGTPYIDKQLCEWLGAETENRRNANLTYCLYGTLKQIQYPTGGLEVFKYELNDYSRSVAFNRQSLSSGYGTGGGLRIKSITEYDSSSSKNISKVREYDYRIPGSNTSSGILAATPKYSWGEISPSAGYEGKFYTGRIQSSSVVPLVNSFGPTVGYSFVTETVKESSEAIKKTEYHYSNYSDAGCFDNQPIHIVENYPVLSSYDEFSSVGFKRGNLLSVKTYGKDSTLLRSIAYNYRNDDFMDRYCVWTSNLDAISGGANYTGGIYKIYYPKYDIVKTVENTHAANGKYLTSVTQYDKTDFLVSGGAIVRKCTSITTTRNGGDYSKISFTYPAADDMFAKDFYFPATKSIRYRNSKVIGTQQVYYQKLSFANGCHMVPKAATKCDGDQWPYNSSTGMNGYKVISFDSYNTNGRLTAYTETGKAQTIQEWDMYGRLRSREIANQKSCYNYYPSGLTSSIERANSNISSFIYDFMGRLTHVYDKDNSLVNKYDYAYRNIKATDDGIPSTVTAPLDNSEEALPCQNESETVSAIANSYSSPSATKEFVINCAQNVTLEVRLETNQTSTWGEASLADPNGNIIKRYQIHGKDDNKSERIVIALNPGKYILYAYSASGTSSSYLTSVSIKATFVNCNE